jgi:hypothetical protein
MSVTVKKTFTVTLSAERADLVIDGLSNADLTNCSSSEKIVLVTLKEDLLRATTE